MFCEDPSVSLHKFQGLGLSAVSIELKLEEEFREASRHIVRPQGKMELLLI
jgi:hypothetical protein